MRTFIFSFFLAAASVVYSQTSCSAISGGACLSVTVSNSSMDTAPAGSTGVLYDCVGGPTGCSLANLNAFIANPGSTSQWESIAFPMVGKGVVVYNFPAQYSSLLNFAASTTNLAAGGAAGPVSAITTFQMPPPPQTTPSLVVGPTLTTTGTTGPQ